MPENLGKDSEKDESDIEETPIVSGSQLENEFRTEVSKHFGYRRQEVIRHIKTIKDSA